MKLIITLFSFLLLFNSCKNTDNFNKAIVTNGINIPKNINTIITTAPSNTEVVMGLGLTDKLIAVSNYDNDTILKNKKKLKFDIINIEYIIELNPSIVIVSEHNMSNGSNRFKQLEKFNIPVIYIPTAKKINDIYRDIQYISRITDTKIKGDSIINFMKLKLNEIKNISSNIKNHKNIYFELDEWNGTMYSFGKNTFLDNILKDLNLNNIFREKESWIKPSSESIILKNPEIIITNSMNKSKGKQKFEKREGWDNINAVKDSNIFYINSDRSSRGSQRILECYLEIAKKVYPKEYEGFKL